MASFQNGDGSYNISHSVALAVAVALETEQRNRNYVHHQNEYQLLHLRNVLEITNFAHPGGYYGVLRSTRVVPVIFRRQISNVAHVKYKSYHSLWIPGYFLLLKKHIFVFF